MLSQGITNIIKRCTSSFDLYFGRCAVILIVIATAVSGYAKDALSADNIITVYLDQEAGEVNRNIFGTNILGLDPVKKNWPSYYIERADYGTGIWNPEQSKSVPEIVKLAQNAGISVVRYATGNHFNWKDAIGKKRKHFLYGIDEYLKTVKEIGAEPDFTVAYFTGNAQDAADLVEYLNVVNDSNHAWARKRVENGHTDPYAVKYFEFGNEVFVTNKKDKKQVDPEDYAVKYLAYQKAMKGTDPSIKLGLSLHHYDWRWDYRVLEIVGDTVDFVVRHVYPPKDLAYYTSSEDYKDDELFKLILGSISFYTEKQFIDTQRIIRETTGKDDVPYAITEFNIGIHHKPQYKFSLGAALVNAELIRIFMNPENKVLMANNWDFIEEYFGMVKLVGDYVRNYPEKSVTYIKRPSYYVYELYNNHFGEILLKADVNVETFDISTYKHYMRAHINNMSDRTLIEYAWLNNKWINSIKRSVMRTMHAVKGNDDTLGENILSDQWKIKKIPGITAEVKDQVLKIDFVNPVKYNYYHSVKQASVTPDTYYKLSGFIKTVDFKDDKGITLEVEDERGWEKTHSAAHTDTITGNVDWQYVEVIYKTLPDAALVNVRARRAGRDGPLKGAAYFKDIKLQQYTPPDTSLSFLTVNASKNKGGDKVYLMVVNKNMKEPIISLIDIKNFLSYQSMSPSGADKKAGAVHINTWTLNGHSVDSTNEKKNDNVRLVAGEVNINKIPFEVEFKPHSLTAIEITKN